MKFTHYVTSKLFLLLALTASPQSFSGEAPPLNHPHSYSTMAERSNWRRTGRNDEVIQLCKKYSKNFPTQVRCFEFARSPENRPVYAMVLSRGALTSKEAKAKQRPVVFFQGGIHAGEIDGKDAGFLLVADLIHKKALGDVLSKVTLVFIPVFNVDGHERVGKFNRPNQNGPEEMGFRTNGQNLNLNRDYTKVETPEVQGLLRLMNEWDPIVYADFHTTDGADFAHDISFTLSPTRMGPEGMRKSAWELQKALQEHLTAQNYKPLDFYPVLVDEGNPAKGFNSDVPSLPRFSNNYWAERNRIGILVETHSWKSFEHRVRSTYQSMIQILKSTEVNGKQWMKVAKECDQNDQKLSGSPFVLSYKLTDKGREIDFQGYAYKIEPSAISGKNKISYDSTRPEVWRVPLYDEVKPEVSVVAPKEGYFIPPAHAAWLQEKLRLHDIRFSKEKKDRRLSVEVFHAEKIDFGKAPREGRTSLQVDGTWKLEEQDILAGSLFVPMAQPRARLVLQLLEPKATDSFLGWGFFNSHFIRAEYMEAYVVEAIAPQMLASDTKLKSDFEKKIKEDPAFAKDPEMKLDFFYRRHPSWDERYARYPIFRR